MSAVAKNAHVWERDELDWYVEPERCTRQLLARERFMGPIWDPACGGGNIVLALLACGHQAKGTDIVRRVGAQETWFHGERDFLKMIHPVAGNIVCNPPFFRAKGAEAFIRKAHELAWGKIAMFLDIRFLAGADRATGLYQDLPPSRIWIVTPRASCPPGQYLMDGGKAGHGSSDWCWVVWDKTAPAPAFPALGWLTAEDEVAS
ncbi:hypothetical protein E5163_14825 [Marinicauda algicola]|uniref:Class I SAM-dependent methyltransferase n=1 Tax=Marinicauda algicola TaxID=2029849 RepID=A0A4V3RXP7_9PROT|nr:hypothetical protein [Marinicauda algicola]TGY87339.1 hypothetical protein E5163_14825 [Marinicauda algicola]